MPLMPLLGFRNNSTCNRKPYILDNSRRILILPPFRNAHKPQYHGRRKMGKFYFLPSLALRFHASIASSFVMPLQGKILAGQLVQATM
jgi:hypothetical protein